MDATLDALFGLRDLFESGKHWCELEIHREEKRFLFFTNHRYCLVGGIEHISGGDRHNYWHEQPSLYLELNHELEKAAKEIVGYRALMTINDEGGHAVVMHVIDRAIDNRKKGIDHLDFQTSIGDALKEVESDLPIEA